MTGEQPPYPATRSYDGDGITVSYDAHRCPHAAGRGHDPRTVFDVARKPWKVPERASADERTDAGRRCPGGAPRYHRTDGMPDEVPDTRTASHTGG